MPQPRSKVCKNGDCDHRQDEHRLSKAACRKPWCACVRFDWSGQWDPYEAPEPIPAVEPAADEVPVVELEIVEIQPPADPEPKVVEVQVADDGLSTSALLAKAERERDSLARRSAVRFEEAEKLRAELSNALQCFDELQTAAGRKYQELGAERDEALAEIERLRTAVPRPTPHLDRVKAERDEALRDLAALRESLNGSASTASSALAERDDLAAELENVRTYVALIIEATGLEADHTGAVNVVGWIAEKRTELDNLRISRGLAERRLAELDVAEPVTPAGYVAVPSGLLLDSSPRWFCQPITGCGEVYHQEQEGGRCTCGHLLVCTTVTVTHHRGVTAA